MCNLASSNAEERQFCRDNCTAAGGRGSERLDSMIPENTIFVKSQIHIFYKSHNSTRNDSSCGNYAAHELHI